LLELSQFVKCAAIGLYVDYYFVIVRSRPGIKTAAVFSSCHYHVTAYTCSCSSNLDSGHASNSAADVRPGRGQSVPSYLLV